MAKPLTRYMAPRTPAQVLRRHMALAPITMRRIPGKSWGGCLITREVPTDGHRSFPYSGGLDDDTQERFLRLLDNVEDR